MLPVEINQFSKGNRIEAENIPAPRYHFCRIVAGKRPTQNRRMRPRRALLAVNRAGASRIDGDEVVPQLRAQADGLCVVMILPVARLMSQAFIKGLRFAVIGIAHPDAIVLPAGQFLSEFVSLRSPASLHGGDRLAVASPGQRQGDCCPPVSNKLQPVEAKLYMRSVKF